MIYIALSPVHGWGVFARCNLEPQQLVEECVAFELSNEYPDVLAHYRLAWTDAYDAMASGSANLYNHSDDPNVEFKNNIEQKTITVRAIKAIAAGEELFKKYVCPVWW